MGRAQPPAATQGPQIGPTALSAGALPGQLKVWGRYRFSVWPLPTCDLLSLLSFSSEVQRAEVGSFGERLIFKVHLGMAGMTDTQVISGLNKIEVFVPSVIAIIIIVPAHI